MSEVRLAILGSHPVTYRVPLYQALSNEPGLDALVVYGDDYGVRPRKSRWGVDDFVWQMPMTDGYRHVFVPNRAPKPDPSNFFGKVNPGLWRALGDFDPHAVLISGYAGVYQLQSFAGAWLSRRKVLYTADTNVLGDRGGVRGRVRSAMLRSLYRGVDVFLSPGTRANEHYAAHGVPASKIVRFPLAVDNAAFRAAAERLAPSRETIRAKWNIPANRACVLSVSRLTPWKNVDAILEAAVGVPEAHVLIVGSGPEESALRAKASSLLPGRHTFAGFLNIDAIAEAYVAADVYALASHYEPWGLTVNEAMNFGLPLVLSDRVGAAADLVRPGDTGEVFPAGDAGAFRAALGRVVQRLDGDRVGVASRVRADVDRYSVAAQVMGLREGLAAIGL